MRNRFLLKALAPKVEVSTELQKRLVICHILDNFTVHQFGADHGWREEFMRKYNPSYREDGYTPLNKIYHGISAIHPARLDHAITELLSITFPKTSHDVMLQMTPEAGIDMARDFEMDEEYLKGKTKDELLNLIQELGLKCESEFGVPLSTTSKKGWIIRCILAQDLVGKLPAAVAEESRLEISVGNDGEDAWCDACDSPKEDCNCNAPDLSESDGTGEPMEESEVAGEVTGDGTGEPLPPIDPEDDPTMPQPTKTGRKKRARANV